MKQKSRLCKHHLHGYCQRKNICEYIHEPAICQNHCPTPIGGSKCQDTACELRHPRLCLHFLQAECHFGKRCLLFHPVGILPALPYPLVTKLQQDLEKMRIQISNLKEEVRLLKEPKSMQTSMLVQPRRITKPKIPPDPSPIPATTLIAAADQVLPITTDHVPVSPMHEDIPSTTAGSLTASAAACLEPPQFSLQSGLYQPRSEEAIRAIKDMHLHSANLALERCYTQVGTEKEKAIVEENEDQSIHPSHSWRSSTSH